MGNANNNRPELAWPLRNDQIVLMALGGTSHKDIAAAHNITPQMVSKIVNDPRADEIVRIAKQKLRERIFTGMEENLDLAAKAALKVIQKTLDAEISPTHKAKANQDRVAIKMLQGRGFLGVERGEDSGFKMSPEQFGRLEKALQKADAASEIEIRDAEYTIVDDEEDEEEVA